MKRLDNRSKSNVGAPEVVMHQLVTRQVSLFPVVGTADLPTTGSGTVVLPAIRKCAHVRTLTMVLVDRSGSVTAHSDPTKALSNVLGEGRAALAHLGTCRCANELVAIAFFDPGQYDTGPQPLTRRGWTRLRHAVDNPPDFTGSDLGPSLAVAEDLADQHPDHELSLIVVSDFELFDPDVEDVLDRFVRWPGRRHAVVLHSPVPDRLKDQTLAEVTHVVWDTTPGAIAQALIRTLTTGRMGPVV